MLKTGLKYCIIIALAFLPVHLVKAADAFGYGYAVMGMPSVLHPMDAFNAPITSSFTLQNITILSGPRYGKAEVDINEQAIIYTADTAYMDADTIVCYVQGSGASNFKLTYIITQAPDVGSQGTEFWVGFLETCLYCGFDDATLRFTAASLYDADIKVYDVAETYFNHFIGNFHVNAGSLATLEVPHDQENYFGVKHFYNRGWLVTSSAPITLYAANTQDFSTDATGVLPTAALGSEYILQSWDAPSLDLPAEGVIIAVQNDTKVHISSPTEMIDVIGKEVDVVLQRGEAYAIMVDSKATVPSLCGIHVKAEDNKKLAVFQGDRMTFVPNRTYEAGDHIYEQAMPVSSWGKDFLVPYLSKQGRDFIRITAAQDGTNFTYNGQSITLNARQTYTGPISDLDYEEIHSNNPIACYVYSSCQTYKDSTQKSDPAMMVIHPDKQLTHKSIFHSFNLVNGHPSKHYIILTGRNTRECDVILDGQPIGRGGTIEPVFYRRLEVNSGVHKLECETGILGYAYGCSHHETYAYPVASMFRELRDTLVVIEDTICANEMYHFGSHFYNETGIYYDTVRNLRWADSITELKLEVIPALKYETTEYDTICNGDFYSWHGRIYNQDGFYSDTLTTIMGCDSVVHLDLFVRKKQLSTDFWHDPFANSNTAYSDSLHPAFTDTVCSAPYIYHGKSYTTSGVYADTLPDRYGCDSVVYFSLVFQGAIYFYTDTIVPYESLPFTWLGKEYNTYGIYHDTIPTAKGCDSIGTLRLLYSRFYTDTIHICEDELPIFHTPWGDVDAGECDSIIGCIEMTEDSVCLTEAALYVMRDSICICDTTYSILDTTVSYISIQTQPFLWFGNAYTTSGIYQDTLKDGNSVGCDSIGQLILHVTYSDTVFTCDKEPVTFVTPFGNWESRDCDTLTGCLSAAPDGTCLVEGSLYVVRLLADSIAEDTTVCEGAIVRWHGQSILGEGTFYDTIPYRTQSTCDSLYCRITIHRSSAVETQIADTVCFGADYEWHGQTITDITEDRVLKDVLSTTYGCDSVVVMTVHPQDPPITIMTSATICAGTTYTWHTYRDQTFSTQGMYEDTLWTERGCFSQTYALSLLVTNCACDTAHTHTYKQLEEDELPYEWNGHMLQQLPLNETRDTVFVFPTRRLDNSCDSISNMHIHVLEPCEIKSIYLPESWNEEKKQL